mgnify:CR=1 FL=1
MVGGGGGDTAVVKIGTSSITDDEGAIDRAAVGRLCDGVADLRASGHQVVVVTSGAIAIGRRHLGLTPGTLKLEESQAAAACGQIRLAHAYQEALGRHDIGVAQLLLTLDDTEDRRRYLNALSTLNTLLRLGSVPVVNENDTVATGEIRFGDNDRLAARVAAMQAHHAFSQWPADRLVRMSHYLWSFKFPERSIIAKQGEAVRHVFVVTEGCITLKMSAQEMNNQPTAPGKKRAPEIEL